MEITITMKTKILTTSIMAITILGLIIPTNLAHASLIGDDVTVELVGADAGNGVNPQTATVTTGLGPEFSWGSSGACGSPDESVAVDVEDSTITVSWGEFTGAFFLCDSLGADIAAPLTLDITDLDWVGTPEGIVTGISVQSNPSTVTTTPSVTGDHSVEIEIALSGIETSGSVVYDLETSHNVACSEDEKICKLVTIDDADGDGIIEVGELITYTFHFRVSNDSGEDWTNVVVKDNFAADLDVIEPEVSITQGTFDLTQKGNSAKESLSWDVGSLADGNSAELVLTAITDLNPAGHQEYTECSNHDINSGATLKYKDENNKQKSASTESITVSVLTEDAQGDCDGDGFIDQDELDLGTDPHDPADFPACGGSSIVDQCIDGDGVATSGTGAFSIIKGASLVTWPTGGGSEGIDWFDTDTSGTWTLGDDLHAEDPAGSCPTAVRNGFHDIGMDCKVLDLDSSLIGGEAVSCDLEVGAFCSAAHLTDLSTTGIKFEDSNTSTMWDSGEDIILDVNGDGIFN
ncbi:MAG TPA: hypothetical protein VLA53_02345 [Nitrosopumilaceae archaeon]|nr:hypothetical protein [Nitrosopumilaceae archaeon]